jgi:hypothetical protein
MRFANFAFFNDAVKKVARRGRRVDKIGSMRSEEMLLRKIKSAAVMAFAACALCAANPAQAFILYQDNFDGAAVPINGLALDVNNYGSATWTGAPIFQADGLIDFVDIGSEGGLSVPFEPQDGAIYTLTAVIRNEGAGWVGVGFAQDSATAVNDVNNRHSNNMDGYIWGLTRDRGDQPDQQFFRGPQAQNGLAAASGDLVNPLADVTVKVVLDTNNPSAWAYEVFYNNTSFGGPQVLDAAVTTTLRNSINFVGFSKDTANQAADPDISATIESFLLETNLSPCDVDLANGCTIDDFHIIRSNLFNTGMTRAQGDLTGGGTVDFADFRLWKKFAPPVAAAQANAILLGVPEPSAAILMVIGGAAWMCGVRRNRSLRLTS